MKEDYQKKYYQEHREEILAKSQKQRDFFKRQKEYAKKYHEEHREEIRKRQKEYYKKNRERILQRTKEWQMRKALEEIKRKEK